MHSPEEKSPIRMISVEEHVGIPEAMKRLPKQAIIEAGWTLMPASLRRDEQLNEAGPRRLAEMDRTGVDVQILSVGPPDSNILSGNDAVQFDSICNTGLAEIVAQHPDRFGAFAHLPLSAPEDAADVLEQCIVQHGFHGAMINGKPMGRFLDDPVFAPVLERAEKLSVPIYLHPSMTPRSVREAYYSGLPDDAGMLIATAAWGWHYEVCVHLLRLAVSGTLEKFPRLKLIVGHMGEGLSVMLDRCNLVMGASVKERGLRSISDTLKQQLWISTSGFHDQPSFVAAKEAFGIDRILYSADYPFNHEHARSFFDVVQLSAEEASKIAFRNAKALLRLPTDL